MRLAHLTPVGTKDLPVHLQLRETIENQQQQLEELHHKPISQNAVSLELIETTITSILQQHGVKRYGVCEIQEEYLYENADLHPRESQLLVIVIPMHYDAMITAPSLESATELFRAYKTGGEVVLDLTTKLRNMGVQVTAHHPLGDVNQYHHLLLPPHAQAAGLGEKGRTGLFIDYELGPLVRLAAISMDTDLPASKSQKRGIFEFCHRCRYCVNKCPPRALPGARYMDQFVSGDPIEFKINAQRCFPYFENHHGCGKCIVHCILADPDRSTIARRMDRIEKWYQKWIVSGELEKMYQQELQAP